MCNDHPTEHADDCPRTLLIDATTSAAGVLLDRALALDFALDKGFYVDLADTPADEFNILRILKAQMNKHELELADKDKRYGKA